jgi:hypothetical protein
MLRKIHALQIFYNDATKASLDAQRNESAPALRDAELSRLDHVLRHRVVLFHLRE